MKSEVLAYRVTLPSGDCVTVSVTSSSPDEMVPLCFSGPAVATALVARWLAFEPGWDGHLLEDRASARDLAAVMARARTNPYSVSLLQGKPPAGP